MTLTAQELKPRRIAHLRWVSPLVITKRRLMVVVQRRAVGAAVREDPLGLALAVRGDGPSREDGTAHGKNAEQHHLTFEPPAETVPGAGVPPG
jgi:hypothetical protein